MTMWKNKQEHELTNSPGTADESKGPSSPAAGDGQDRKIQSALSSGTKIEGKLNFDKPVRIDGELKGELRASEVLVVIGRGAKVDAQVEAAELVIMGEVRGVIRGLKRVELLDCGSVFGDIETKELIIQEGAKFNGSCKMPQADQTVQLSTQTDDTLERRERKIKREGAETSSNGAGSPSQMSVSHT